jgi:hypothetical protein
VLALLGKNDGGPKVQKLLGRDAALKVLYRRLEPPDVLGELRKSLIDCLFSSAVSRDRPRTRVGVKQNKVAL